MYLEIDEGYFEHPKTLDLCARLEDAKASLYPLRLWKWACRSAKSGKLGRISAFAIEKAVDYDKMDGRAFAALRDAGFVDVAEDGTAEIHDWMSYTGGALKRMEDKASENRRRREEGKRRYEAEKNQANTNVVPESYQHRTGTNPSKTRQDQSRQDKTSQEREEGKTPPPDVDGLAPSLAASGKAVAAAKCDIEKQTPSPVVEVQRAALAALQSQPEAEPKTPIAYDWLRSFQIAHRNKFEKDYGHGEQDAKATGRLSELLESLPLAERLSDWERRREMFAEFLGRTDARTQSAGWSFAFFVQDFRALAIPVDKRPKPLEKPQFGPRPAARPTQYAKV